MPAGIILLLAFQLYNEITTYSIYNYNVWGELENKEDVNGNITAEYTYDCMGRILQEKDANGIVSTYEYNQSGLVSSMTMTSPRGEEKNYEYTIVFYN